MARVLRIIFCILAVLCAAAALIVGVVVDWTWCLLLVAGTIGFAAAMFFFKAKDDKQHAPPPVDFMNPPADKPEGDDKDIK